MKNDYFRSNGSGDGCRGIRPFRGWPRAVHGNFVVQDTRVHLDWAALLLHVATELEVPLLDDLRCVIRQEVADGFWRETAHLCQEGVAIGRVIFVIEAFHAEVSVESLHITPWGTTPPLPAWKDQPKWWNNNVMSSFHVGSFWLPCGIIRK